MAHLGGVSNSGGSAIVRGHNGGGGGGGGGNVNRIEGLFLFPKPPPPSSLSLKPPSILRLNSNSIAPSFRLNAMKKAEEVKDKKQLVAIADEVVVEEEEDLPWIQEKALDLVEFTGSVSQTLPGPRVGQSSLPWLLAVPLAYAGITLVIAFFRTVNKFTSPKHKRRKLVNKNATLCKSMDELFEKGRDQLQHSALLGLVQKTSFGMEEILRKYIRYAMNERPFNPDMVADLIQLRKASLLEDTQVAEILNDISRRIVADKGPVVMDISGYSEKGFKRKLAVQALFGKIFYLSELPEFCLKESSLIIKEIFGVTDEDAITLRTHTLSEAGDVDSLEKMVGNSDSDQFDEESIVSSQE